MWCRDLFTYMSVLRCFDGNDVVERGAKYENFLIYTWNSRELPSKSKEHKSWERSHEKSILLLRLVLVSS